MPKLFFFIMLYFVSISTIVQTDLLASAPSINNSQDVCIIKIESMAQITDSQPSNTLYFFDLDDTLFDSPTMLGSKMWRKYITTATKNDQTQNWHDIFSLFIARNHPLETVEPITSQFIKKLQTKGSDVFGLTARERKKWYDTPINDVDVLTVAQLDSLGINFNREVSDKNYSYLTNTPEYFEGVFFADLEPKGEYFLKLFKDAPQLPEKVIFVDDKESQIESVAKALHQLGIDHECYWYVNTDEKAKKFDPLIANIQLYYLWTSKGTKVLSDDEAASIAKQHPDKTAEDYLHSVKLHEKIEGINIGSQSS